MLFFCIKTLRHRFRKFFFSNFNTFLHIERAQFDLLPEHIVEFQELESLAAQMLGRIPRLSHFSMKDLIPDQEDLNYFIV